MQKKKSLTLQKTKEVTIGMLLVLFTVGWAGFLVYFAAGGTV